MNEWLWPCANRYFLGNLGQKDWPQKPGEFQLFLLNYLSPLNAKESVKNRQNQDLNKEIYINDVLIFMFFWTPYLPKSDFVPFQLMPTLSKLVLFCLTPRPTKNWASFKDAQWIQEVQKFKFYCFFSYHFLVTLIQVFIFIAYGKKLSKNSMGSYISPK